MKSAPRILIVEDEGVIAMNLRRKLEQMGFVITSVEDNSEDALRAAREDHPDLVMMDIIIQGGVDGIETAQKLRAQQDIPVIFLTAHSDERTVERAKAALPYGYLIKPFEERELKTTIEMALYRHQTEGLQRLQEQAIASAASAIVIANSREPGLPVMMHNPAFERLTGCSRKDVEGKGLLSFFPSSPEHPSGQQIADVLVKGFAGQVTIHGKRSDQTSYWADITVSEVHDNAGQTTHHVVILQDATQRVNSERMALRSQRLESIGTLAGGVAHDLNNALAPIMMGVEVLKMRHPEDSNIVDWFETSARRAAEMVRQLLTFAKGADGQRVLIQPSHLVTEMENLIQGSFPKNIQLAVKSAPNLPAVLGDSTQLHQVLLNLCVNARDAMPHGGMLTLEAECLEMDAADASAIPDAQPGKYLVLRVHDTGTGIPSEILDRIFDPFFSTKGPDRGTGLGLSTVMGIVKGHGGFLHVSSQPGNGSTFTAYLPADSAGTETEHIAKAEVEFRGQGETILLVDDESSIRMMANAVLQRLNFNTLTATNGADGLIQAAQHRAKISAIITDLHMPHMDGLAFVHAVRRMLPDIPVLVASGRMDDAVTEGFKALGVTSHLDKPFTEAQLAEAMKNLLAPK